MKAKSITIVSVWICVILFMNGCVTTDWEAAKSSNTRSAYETFMTQHPNSSQAAKAKMIINGDVKNLEEEGGSVQDIRICLTHGWSKMNDTKAAFITSTLLDGLQSQEASSFRNTMKMGLTKNTATGGEEMATLIESLTYIREKQYLYFGGGMVAGKLFWDTCYLEGQWYAKD